jgi:hypothetical protein
VCCSPQYLIALLTGVPPSPSWRRLLQGQCDSEAARLVRPQEAQIPEAQAVMFKMLSSWATIVKLTPVLFLSLGREGRCDGHVF